VILRAILMPKNEKVIVIFENNPDTVLRITKQYNIIRLL
jgi:hypothetical protein